MTEKPALSSYVLLKDGTMLECTAEQKSQLGMAILMAKDMSKTKVKLGGRIFTLDELESDPEKIFKSKQTAMAMPGTEAKKNQNMG